MGTASRRSPFPRCALPKTDREVSVTSPFWPMLPPRNVLLLVRDRLLPAARPCGGLRCGVTCPRQGSGSSLPRSTPKLPSQRPGQVKIAANSRKSASRGLQPPLRLASRSVAASLLGTASRWCPMARLDRCPRAACQVQETGKSRHPGFAMLPPAAIVPLDQTRRPGPRAEPSPPPGQKGSGDRPT